MDTENSCQFVASTKTKGTRLDKFLTLHMPDLSRSYIQNLIENSHVTKNCETITDCSYRVKPDDCICITVPETEPSHMTAADIPLNVVFEDDDFLVIDKPVGMTVHPGAGNHTDTMANALLAHCPESLSGIGGVSRPGIVHRLDKDTSGLILVAKHDLAHKNLSTQISKRTAKRRYLALCWGVPIPHNGTITTLIDRNPKNRIKMAVVKKGGKEAITHYSVKEIFGNGVASLVECRLETGRTHQIRVHLTHTGHPLIGDQTYGSSKKILHTLSESKQLIIKNFMRQALHSYHLGVEHPITGNYMEFRSEIPDDMQKVIDVLRDLHDG